MEVYFYNPTGELRAVIDQYWSLIWTERYSEYGDFEIVVDPQYVPSEINVNYMVMTSKSDIPMIVESIQIETDPEEGDKVTLSGRSFVTVLMRRIVWTQTFMNGYLQQCLYNFLDANVLNPTIPERRIDILIFAENTTDPYINGIAIEMQRSYEELYDVVKDICDAFELGFKTYWDDKRNKVVFYLYRGLDRTFDSGNNPVIFSDEFDNLINSSYSQSIKDYKNMTLIAGEGEGADRKITYSGDTTASGLNRYELYTDARDLSTNNENTSEEEYYAQLISRGDEKLAERGISTAFSGEIDYNSQYTYGVDYNLGDVVQIKTKYGVYQKVRITEYIITDSSHGYSAYPTFVLVED